MATSSVSRRKAKPSPHDPKDLSHIKSAADHMDEAVRALRIAGSMFGPDGLEQCDPGDVHHVVSAALSAMEMAADDLFSLHCGSAADRAAVPVLIHLYNCIDVTNVLVFALVGGKFPPKNTHTCSPTAGTIAAAGSMLPGLRAKLIKFLDQVPAALRSRRSTAPSASGEAQAAS